jgi:hypothetical protein
MSYDPNQGQQSGGTDPYSGYGNPQNPYGTPPPENPYGTPPPENPYEAPGYGGTNYGDANYQNALPGQPGYGYGYPPPPQQPGATPLPLGQAIQQLPNQYIKVLTHPSAQTFAEEMGKADWGIVWVQLIGYAVIAAILGFLASLISSTSLNTAAQSGMSPAAFTAILGGISFFYIIIIPLGFFIGTGILYGIAKAFGGQGSFVQQCYTTLLFEAPLGILISLFGLIPIAGSFIGFAIDIYAIVLEIFALMAVHRLSGGKATAVVLIPLAVAVVLICGLFIVLFAIIASATRNGG